MPILGTSVCTVYREISTSYKVCMNKCHRVKLWYIEYKYMVHLCFLEAISRGYPLVPFGAKARIYLVTHM